MKERRWLIMIPAALNKHEINWRETDLNTPQWIKGFMWMSFSETNQGICFMQQTKLVNVSYIKAQLFIFLSLFKYRKSITLRKFFLIYYNLLM